MASPPSGPPSQLAPAMPPCLLPSPAGRSSLFGSNPQGILPLLADQNSAATNALVQAIDSALPISRSSSSADLSKSSPDNSSFAHSSVPVMAVEKSVGITSMEQDPDKGSSFSSQESKRYTLTAMERLQLKQYNMSKSSACAQVILLLASANSK